MIGHLLESEFVIKKKANGIFVSDDKGYEVLRLSEDLLNIVVDKLHLVERVSLHETVYTPN